MTRKFVPLSSPDLSDAERAAVKEVLATPYLRLWTRIAEFEESFAAYVGTRHAVGVSSGSADHPASKRGHDRS